MFMKKMTYLLLLFLFSGSCLASISVGPLRLEFGSGHSKPANIIIKNTGDKIAFVKLDVNILTGLNTKQRKETLLKNSKKYGLLVMPRKLILRPHQNKTVRVMLTKSLPEQDIIFMINTYEVEAKAKLDETGAIVGIVYGTSIIVHASQASPKIEVTRNGKELTIENTGSTSAKVVSIKQCIKPNECKDPGILFQSTVSSKKIFKLPYDMPLKYQVRYLDKVEVLTSK
jgi:P pilus assembly chaperone PapD